MRFLNVTMIQRLSSCVDLAGSWERGVGKPTLKVDEPENDRQLFLRQIMHALTDAHPRAVY